MNLDLFTEPLKKINPQKVILFGSYAYGMPTASSDIDLLVVMETSEPFHKRIQRIRSLLPKNKAVDLIVLTPGEYQQSKFKNPLVKEIVEKGRVIYE